MGQRKMGGGTHDLSKLVRKASLRRQFMSYAVGQWAMQMQMLKQGF